jgi:LysM repeat protein
LLNSREEKGSGPFFLLFVSQDKKRAACPACPGNSLAGERSRRACPACPSNSLAGGNPLAGERACGVWLQALYWRFILHSPKGEGWVFCIGDMQKDFKIGLAIGVTLAAGAILWLATLPNLSARARALQAASNINPSPQTPPIASSPVTSPIPSDSRTTSDEPRVTGDNFRTTNNAQPTTNSESTQRIHIIQKGDTLSSISAKYYGSARQWRKILTANRDNLPDPNRLTPGSKLLIPQ